MTTWAQRRRGAITLGILVFGQILMVGHQVRDERNESRLRHWSGAVILPVQSGVQAVLGSARNFVDGYLWTVHAGEENRKLETQASRLQIENHFLRQELLRLESRKDLDAFRGQLASETLHAEVIGQGVSRIAKEMFLDRGTRHGVRPGMAVTTPDGIVGKTAAVHPGSSMVLLISDSEAGAGVLLAHSGEPGVLRGTGAWDCRIDYIGPHVRVAVGEFVYTSGLDGVFPRGLPVGQVSSVAEGVEAQEIRVRPFADLRRLRDVLLVVAPGHESLPPDVQRAISASHGRSDGRMGTELGQSAPTQADLIKRVYRDTVASQERKVGALSYSGPPEFGDAARALRAARSSPPAESEGGE